MPPTVIRGRPATAHASCSVPAKKGVPDWDPFLSSFCIWVPHQNIDQINEPILLANYAFISGGDEHSDFGTTGTT